YLLPTFFYILSGSFHRFYHFSHGCPEFILISGQKNRFPDLKPFFRGIGIKAFQHAVFSHKAHSAPLALLFHNHCLITSAIPNRALLIPFCKMLAKKSRHLIRVPQAGVTKSDLTCTALCYPPTGSGFFLILAAFP